MVRHIQAYFKSEDQVEGARTSLFTFETEQVEVGRLDDAIDNDRDIVFPFMTSTYSSTAGTYGVIGYPGSSSGPGMIPIAVPSNRNAGDLPEEDLAFDRQEAERSEGDIDLGRIDLSTKDDHFSGLQYVLSARVKDEDYDRIVHKLRSHGAYVEKTD